MRWSNFYLHTARESPADAEVISHQLMARAGMLRKHAAGIYTYQPLGWRSLQKLMAIVRRELDRAGALELSMPAVQPAELWQESGRWKIYGKELLRLQDRHEREFCFGPTHEEVVTDLVRRDIKSYRQLPINLYQIQTKFRDEIRPRFGLMRGREFLMKDAYSFHADEESLDQTYREMHDAYSRIIEACGLDYVVVEADSGTIGGSSSHEFMVLADTGESAVVRCAACGYGANEEKASTRFGAESQKTDPAAVTTKLAALREVPTPGLTTIAQVAEHLGCAPAQMVKTLIYEVGESLVAAVVRGDREVNEIKLQHILGVVPKLATEQAIRKATGAAVGFAGPVGLPAGVRLIADQSTSELTDFVAGANRDDVHLVGVNWGRDAAPDDFVDLLRVTAGDACPRCGEQLAGSRGIEVGHIFKLGSAYSEAMGCTFTDADGRERPMIMGCYGLGIGRTVAAAIEQNHDADGIVWPLPLAPFAVLLQALNTKDAEVLSAAETVYDELRSAGVEVLFDDRDQRPGVKFKDADLIGVPVRVVVGARSLAEGSVELSLRRGGERELVPLAELSERIGECLTGL